jgi:hypothetical protein
LDPVPFGSDHVPAGSELRLADGRQFSVQICSGDSLDGDRQRHTVTSQASKATVAVARGTLKHERMPASVSCS